MTRSSVPLLFAFILGFVGFVTSFGAHIVAVNLPEYATEVGVGVAMIGVLIAAYDLELAPIGGQLSALDVCLGDQNVVSSPVDTSATRLLARPLSRNCRKTDFWQDR